MEAGKFCTPDMCSLCEEIASAYGLDETLNVLARNMANALNARACAIYLFEREKLSLVPAASHGLPIGLLPSGPRPVKEGSIELRVLGGEVVDVPDIAGRSDVLDGEALASAGVRSASFHCLRVRGRALGLVAVYSDAPRELSEVERRTARTLTSLGGVLADRATIWERMETLIETARSLSSTLSLDEVLGRLVERAAESLDLKAASIRLLGPERERLDVRATYGLSDAYLAKGPVEVARSPLDRECIAGNVVEISDVERDGRLQYQEAIREEGIGALLSVPLTSRGTVLGVLRVYTAHPYKFSRSEVDYISALASHGAAAIENARLFEHIQKEYEELTRDVWKWYDWGARFPRM
ncbi:MAG: GAF domain-containing protein [Nitrospirota bacterium]